VTEPPVKHAWPVIVPPPRVPFDIVSDAALSEPETVPPVTVVAAFVTMLFVVALLTVTAPCENRVPLTPLPERIVVPERAHAFCETMPPATSRLPALTQPVIFAPQPSFIVVSAHTFPPTSPLTTAVLAVREPPILPPPTSSADPLTHTLPE